MLAQLLKAWRLGGRGTASVDDTILDQALVASFRSNGLLVDGQVKKGGYHRKNIEGGINDTLYTRLRTVNDTCIFPILPD